MNRIPQNSLPTFWVYLPPPQHPRVCLLLIKGSRGPGNQEDANHTARSHAVFHCASCTTACNKVRGHPVKPNFPFFAHLVLRSYGSESSGLGSRPSGQGVVGICVVEPNLAFSVSIGCLYSMCFCPVGVVGASLYM